MMQPANTSRDLQTRRLQNAKPLPAHIVWINRHADIVGGAERYISAMVQQLTRLGTRSTLLYEVNGEISPVFAGLFSSAFPVVDVAAQLEALHPDLIYLHCLNDESITGKVLQAKIPAIRFYHDHKLFCLREHKYTAVGKHTCTKASGLGCLPCLGFIHRNGEGKLSLRSLADLNRLQAHNRELDGFIVASRYMQHELVQHGFDPRKIHHAPLFCDMEAEDINHSASTATHAMEKQPVHAATIIRIRKRSQFVFAGQLVSGKGLDLLLQAMALLPPHITLLVCGKGRQSAELQTLANNLGLANRVTFLGNIGKQQLKLLYAESTAACMPSRAPETFGLAGLEAMAEGCPVIAARVGGIGEWLIHERTGLFFDSNNARHLAEQMLALVSSPELQATLSRVGRETAARQFTLEQHTSRLLKAISQTQAISQLAATTILKSHHHA